MLVDVRALVVMTEDDRAAPEGALRFDDALLAVAVGEWAETIECNRADFHRLFRTAYRRRLEP